MGGTGAPRAGGTSALGGTSFTTGGSGNVAGTSGTGGTFSNLGALTGEYDITLDTANIDNCRTYQGLHHLNASIRKDSKGSTSVRVFMDWEYIALSPFSITNEEFVISRSESWMTDVLPTLRFRLGPDGFTGTGTADVSYLCPSGTRLISAAAKIGPDITPPRLRVFTYAPGHDLASFELSLFDFSEPVLPEAAWSDQFSTFADPPNSVSIHDAITGLPVAHHWTDWPWASGSALAFDDSGIDGRSVALDMLLPFTDRSGNRAVSDQPYSKVIDGGTRVNHIDFDENAKTYAYGQATYLNSDLPNSPCESGNCLALDYVSPACLGSFNLDPTPATFLTGRFEAAASHMVDVRYRIFSTQPYSLDFQIQEAGGCSYSEGEVRTDLAPLTVPYGIYGYATEWTNKAGGWCLNPTSDVGLYSYLQETCAYPPAKFRLLIERIEIVPK